MTQPKAISVTRKSMITGKIHTKELPITSEQLDAYLSGSVNLQDAFPQLNGADREFIKTGVTGEEWKEHVIGGAKTVDEDEA